MCGNHVDDNCDGGAGECAWDGDYGVDTIGVRLKGRYATELTGWDVNGGGDVDGDGYDDVVVGASYADSAGSDAGSAYLVSGPASADLSLYTEATARIDGDWEDGRFGKQLAIVGDTNGDGYADVLVGAAGNRVKGAAYLFEGPISGELDAGDADRTWVGLTDTDGLGASLAAAGDVDGDGKADFLVGAPYYDSGADGAAYLFSGDADSPGDVDKATGQLYSRFENVGVGLQVAAAGDVDGDGFDDILVNAASADSTWAVALLAGPVTGRMYVEDVAAAMFVGATDLDFYEGRRLAGGDLNGDGYADVLIGATGNSSIDTGRVYLFDGPVSGDEDTFLADAIISGSEEAQKFGYAVSVPGDVDGDGTGDALITAAEDDLWGYSSGAAYLLLGPIRGSVEAREDRAVAFHGPGRDAGLRAAQSAGDVNGDGLIDLIVGAYYTDGDAPNAGAAFLLFGNGS